MATTVAVIALAVFARSWSHPFVYDDVYAVQNHPLVNGAQPWYQILTSPYWPREITPDPLYRPVTLASFRANASLIVHQPFNYHVTNSLLHAWASCLVALLGVRLWGGGRQAPGWIAGLLFATHPLHAEAVVPIVGRSELLAMIFTMTMFYVHLGRIQREHRASVAYHSLLAGLYLLACLSKEHGVLALMVIVAIDAWVWRRGGAPPQSARRRLNILAGSHYLGLILVLAGVLTARWAIFAWQTSMPQGVDNATYNPFDVANTVEQVATPFALTTLAVQLICLPVNLCPIWGKGGIDLATSFWSADVLGGIAIILGLGVALAAAWHRGKRVLIPLAGLLIFLAIPCHFLPVASWFFAERWLYLPSAMLILTCAGAALGMPRLSLVGAVLVAGIFSTITWQYQTSWRSDETIVRTVVERQPTNCLGLGGLCNLLDGRDEIEAAAPYIERLLRYHPDEPKTWYFQARLLAQRGRYSEAKVALDHYMEMTQLPGLTPSVVALSKRIRMQMDRP